MLEVRVSSIYEDVFVSVRALLKRGKRSVLVSLHTGSMVSGESVSLFPCTTETPEVQGGSLVVPPIPVSVKRFSHSSPE